ncbi:MAG TPA: isoprenylcysteine carboxylmethyltransferase family protein [Herpetosiphonaceae bacterium]
MPPEAAHTRWWQTFEVIVGLPVLVALALQWAVPLTLPAAPLTLAARGIGALLLSAGVAVIGLARRELARHRQPTDPGQPTGQLVTSGVFSVSRNPLYLGGILLLAGIALAVNLPWMGIMLLPALVASHVVLVAPEERYLARRFGADYADYAATVCRWLGRR